MKIIKKIMLYSFICVSALNSMEHKQDHLSYIPPEILQHIIFFVATAEDSNIKYYNGLCYFDDFIHVTNTKDEIGNSQKYIHKDILQIQAIKKMVLIAKKYKFLIENLISEPCFHIVFWNALVEHFDKKFCDIQKKFDKKRIDMMIDLEDTVPYNQENFTTLTCNIPQDNALYIRACCNSQWLKEYIGHDHLLKKIIHVSYNESNLMATVRKLHINNFKEGQDHRIKLKRLLYACANLLRPYNAPALLPLKRMWKHHHYYDIKNIFKCYPKRIQEIFKEELQWADTWGLELQESTR